MQSSPVKKFIRWFIPLAALIAFAAWLYIAPPGILGKADSVGYAVCHRIDERSFHIGGRQLPVCARCSGTFTAAFLGLAYLALTARKRSGMPAPKFYLPFALFFLAFTLDGGNSYLYLLKQTGGVLTQIPNLYVPNNTLRLLTGSGMGITMAVFLFPAFNQTAWRDPDPAPVIATWRHFLGLPALMLIVDLLILTGSPLVLYPIALVSPLGVLLLLTVIFGMVWVMLMRQDNTFSTLREMWLPLLAGFTLTLLMILAIDLFRLQLTGTWGAFPLG